ncbi:MAG: FAD-binding oxidoreductase [Thalassobaculales bacterium]
MAGLATAQGLAERGRKVTVLEARRIGWGASGRNGGFVSPGFSLGVDRLIARLGLERTKELFRLTQDAVALIRARIARHDMPCGPIVEGKLTLTRFTEPGAMQRAAEFHAATFGRDIEYWPQARVREALDTPAYKDGMLARDGFHFHPLGFVHGTARAAEAAGAVIHENSPVTAVLPVGERQRVETAEGVVMADQVVVCGGGYLEGVEGRLAAAYVPVGTYVLTTAPDPEIARAIGVAYAISDTRRAGDYYRRLADGRLLWGGRISAVAVEPRRVAALMRRSMLATFPQLAHLEIEAAWAGRMSYAVHYMPQIGRLRPGLWYAQGFGGHGMATTTMGGELIARAIAEGDETWRLFRPFGLWWTGGRIIGALAAQSTYWWYQLRDRFRD